MNELISFLEKTGSEASWGNISVTQQINAAGFTNTAVKNALIDADVERLSFLADARTNIVCMIQVPKEDDIVTGTQTLQISKCA